MTNETSENLWKINLKTKGFIKHFKLVAKSNNDDNDLLVNRSGDSNGEVWLVSLQDLNYFLRFAYYEPKDL